MHQTVAEYPISLQALFWIIFQVRQKNILLTDSFTHQLEDVPRFT